MLNRIKALLSGDAGDDAAPEADALQVAAAALLVEAACMDGDFDEGERATIAALLRGHFDLDEAEADHLVGLAEDKVEAGAGLYGLTRRVKDAYSHDDRVRLIEMLWEVAYADGVLHDFEASLVRRVAGLVYVPDRESGEARKRVLERLGFAAEGSG